MLKDGWDVEDVENCPNASLNLVLPMIELFWATKQRLEISFQCTQRKGTLTSFTNG
jgi:hypothetical protein